MTTASSQRATLTGMIVVLAALLNPGCGGCGDDNSAASPEVDAGTGPSGLSIVIDNPEVRACDLLVMETGATVVGVAFSEDVLGEWERWAPKVALSFAQRADEAVTGWPVQLELRGAAMDADTAFDASTVKCFDRAGRAVDEPGLRFESL